MPSPTSATWTPSGVVTLLTDFGVEDPYVGMMKGVVLARCATARVVDLTHAVPPQNVRLGAWFLAHAARYFPPGTVHVAVVDPGVGSSRRLLVARDEDRVFLAPDNGILGASLSPRARVHELDASRCALPGASRTFHGRDVLAPAAGEIAGGMAPESLALRPVEPVALESRPRSRAVDPGRVECEVLHVDRFGNLILGAQPADLAGDPARWTVETGGRSIPRRETYADARPGELLWLVDSYGALEIAVRDGSAAEALGLGADAVVTMRRNG
jgi:S-adenosylmethionine hydrolase